MMHSFSELSATFNERFHTDHFPAQPNNLYNAARHILTAGGKQVRPVAVLMGNELFGDILPDAYEVAAAIELFHNFTLIHDDIMDKAPLRRGTPTVHTVYGEPTALLAGDVMLVAAYERLNKITAASLQPVFALFSKTAREVCEGQQLDMDFETRVDVTMEEYLEMITLKTSVLLGCSLQMGAVLGGASLGNQQHMYQFGKNLGIAFQVQDDYLDVFGDPDKFGKQVGGDIMSNKKTFLLLHAMQVASAAQQQALQSLVQRNDEGKVAATTAIFKECKVDEWARELKENYYREAMLHLDAVAVTAARKKPLAELAAYLLDRES